MARKLKHSGKNKSKNYRNATTIVANTIYEISDIPYLAQLNFYPLVIKGEFEENTISFDDKIYDVFAKKYACLDVVGLLSKYGNVKGRDENVHLITDGRENHIITMLRHKKGELTIHTEEEKLSVSGLITSLVEQERENNKTLIKERK